ncbi:MAG TPA: hypothetical protein ENJ95_19230, partial [Bacteroidetes bacterium]|nr:hypothetical protein [Bacteroidota bacterium]
MTNRNLTCILFLLLTIDAAYSFYQHYQMPLDGDLAKIVLPVKEYKKVLDDPFGLNVLLRAESYPAPNRFFAHASMLAYFKNVPLLLQKFTNPLDSIYLSCAIAKTGIQLFLIWLLARYISGEKNIFRKNFLLAAILITPLFQTNGYNISMGIIDKSITYTFFYALPLGLLLLFFLPFYKYWWEGKPLGFNIYTKAGLILLAIYLAFSGPLVPGVVLILCPSVLIYFF